MKKIILVIIFLLSINSVFAISKKDSLNQNKALLDSQTMFDAGTWNLYMEKCAGKAHKNFLDDLAKLSWPDFINYKKGMAKYASGYQTAACGKKDTNNGQGFYNWIISELENKTRDLDNNDENKNYITTKDKNEDLETKLKKLKNLFKKELITKEEYDEKRAELLENF